MASDTEVAAMRRAAALAARGLGTTSPNPVVGCVVLDPAGTPVGEGYHAYPGGPHAEIAALHQAKDAARGGTLVVTLEPCGHTGRTGPCVDRILEAGIERVLVGTRDPNPSGAGGLEGLRAAAVDVEVGVLADEAERVNEAWLGATQLHRPFVTWKYAASLDGRVTAADGSSRWVTGQHARTDGHRLRARADAVVVGSGTVLSDDPQLTVRLPDDDELAGRRPLRVVVDTNARTPAAARVLDSAAPTIVAVGEDAAVAHLEAGACVVRLPVTRAGLDLAALLGELYERGVVSLLTEGGPTLAGALLAEGLMDKVVGYFAPALIGGGGLPALAGQGARSIDTVHRLRVDEVTRIGDDLRLTARRDER